MKRWKQILPWLALGTYWPMLFVATHIPRPPHLQIFGRDLTLHFTAYFLLTLLFWLARHHRLRPHWFKRTPYLVIGIIAVYAALDEILQMFVNRHAAVIDWLADVTGCLTALVILTLLRRGWHWLTAYWLVLLILTHWPVKDSAFVTLPPFLQQYEFCFTFTAYVILTLLFWRSCCPQPRFMMTAKVAATTLFVMPIYALFDEFLSHLMGRGFHTSDLLAALSGIFVAILCALAFAQHHLASGKPCSPDVQSKN